MWDPILYLAIDNCFAFKRWTTPAAWSRVIAGLGVSYIEASADTELDPLFMGQAYLEDWLGEVREASRREGTRVSALYSGHGTYSTLGLTHTDARVRRRMTEQWFKPMIDLSAALGAGLGFYAHGFADEVLQDAGRYAACYEGLRASLAELSAYAGTRLPFLCLEQMYAPHMPPWHIEETETLIREISRRSGQPFYITEDVGHHGTRFLRPNAEELCSAIQALRNAPHPAGWPAGWPAGQPAGPRPWLGPLSAYRVFEAALRTDGDPAPFVAEIQAIQADSARFFSSPQDGDCYAWLRRLGPYSPIIHLQQTDGHTSAHWPFTPPYNAKGIIEPRRVLEALWEGFQNIDEESAAALPPCPELYLTLELFTGTTARNDDVLRDYQSTVAYWRQAIPRDGLRLSQLL